MDADAAEDLKVRCPAKCQCCPWFIEGQVLNMMEKFENEESKEDGDGGSSDSASGVIASQQSQFHFRSVTLTLFCADESDGESEQRKIKKAAKKGLEYKL